MTERVKMWHFAQCLCFANSNEKHSFYYILFGSSEDIFSRDTPDWWNGQTRQF